MKPTRERPAVFVGSAVRTIPSEADTEDRPHSGPYENREMDARADRRPPPAIQAIAVAVAAFLMASTLSVFSQVNSGSSRPKWPPLAVLR